VMYRVLFVLFYLFSLSLFALVFVDPCGLISKKCDDDDGDERNTT